MRAPRAASVLALSVLSLAAAWNQDPSTGVRWLELDSATALARESGRPLLIVFR